MTGEIGAIDDLQSRISRLELDRDYWRDQHDLVMQDWRADIEGWSTERDDWVSRCNALGAALADLLRFFDPATGAVAARLGRDGFLSDAFAKAQRLQGAAATAAPREAPDR